MNDDDVDGTKLWIVCSKRRRLFGAGEHAEWLTGHAMSANVCSKGMEGRQGEGKGISIGNGVSKHLTNETVVEAGEANVTWCVNVCVSA